MARRAIDHARSGGGPYLVEFKTFRQRGHGEHDDMSYVPREMREFWERRDPLRLYVEYLMGEGGWSAREVEAVDQECAAVVEAAVVEAQAYPDPSPESVTWRLFAE